MATSLLIVESPAKAKTIQKYLGKDYDVVASKGHIKDLPKRGGVDMENGFKETYEFIEDKGKQEVVKIIRKKAKQVQVVLLATDPDREGEAIAAHLLDIVKKANKKLKVHRVLFNEITKKGVQVGLQDLRELDQDLIEAQRTRRVLDRIGGYPLSSLLWRKLAFGLSAGRVQTPALRIIVDRQLEIEAFKPVHYWLVEAGLVGEKRPSFVASLVSIEGEKLPKVSSRPAIMGEEDATKYVEDLKKADFEVAKIGTREQKRRAPAPYTTSKLQQDASNRLSMAPKRAMRVAQQLYEGIQLGRGKKADTVGLITYMRTDSMRMSADAVEECRGYIAKKYGKGTFPEKPNFFKSKKKNVQDAHEAIRPTSMAYPPDEVQKFLRADQLKLYKLIWNRFVACQMNPAIYDMTSVDIEGKGGKASYGLRVSGSTLKVPGWKAVYGATAEPLAGEEPQEGEEVEEGSLPELTEGEKLTLVVPPGLVSHHKQTEPPPCYNEASLVKKLEEEGIGRPSTYAEIISKVQARDYVQKRENRLVPSPLGRLVIERLVKDKFVLADIGFTRELEESLDAVAEARAKRLDVLAPFHEKLQAKIAKALAEKGKWWPDPVPMEEKCPECGGDLFERWGRNGPFIGCTKYPDCKYTRNVPGEDGEEDDRQPRLTDYDCDKCGAKMLRRYGRNGWFLGCSTYPKCKGTMPIPIGVHCPKCKTGHVIEVRARGRARPFYGCSNYSSDQKCDFRVWQKPVLVPCPRPDCTSTFLVRAGGKANPIFKCSNETCDYERVDNGEDLEAEAKEAQAQEAKNQPAEAQQATQLEATGTEGATATHPQPVAVAHPAAAAGPAAAARPAAVAQPGAAQPGAAAQPPAAKKPAKKKPAKKNKKPAKKKPAKKS